MPSTVNGNMSSLPAYERPIFMWTRPVVYVSWSMAPTAGTLTRSTLAVSGTVTEAPAGRWMVDGVNPAESTRLVRVSFKSRTYISATCRETAQLLGFMVRRSAVTSTELPHAAPTLLIFIVAVVPRAKAATATAALPT